MNRKNIVLAFLIAIVSISCYIFSEMVAGWIAYQIWYQAFSNGAGGLLWYDMALFNNLAILLSLVLVVVLVLRFFKDEPHEPLLSSTPSKFTLFLSLVVLYTLINNYIELNRGEWYFNLTLSYQSSSSSKALGSIIENFFIPYFYTLNVPYSVGYKQIFLIYSFVYALQLSIVQFSAIYVVLMIHHSPGSSKSEPLSLPFLTIGSLLLVILFGVVSTYVEIQLEPFTTLDYGWLLDPLLFVLTPLLLFSLLFLPMQVNQTFQMSIHAVVRPDLRTLVVTVVTSTVLLSVFVLSIANYILPHTRVYDTTITLPFYLKVWKFLLRVVHPLTHATLYGETFNPTGPVSPQQLIWFLFINMFVLALQLVLILLALFFVTRKDNELTSKISDELLYKPSEPQTIDNSA